MSRSYKKTPVVKDHNKGMRAFANRAVRRAKVPVANGKAYRKYSETYDICDFAFRMTYADWRALAAAYRTEYIYGIRRYGYSGPIRARDESQEMTYWAWFKIYRRK